MSTIKTLLDELKYKERLADINYGFNCLNDKLGALDEKSIITIFGTTAQDKTAFTLNLALNAAKKGANVLYLTNKESPLILVKKILSIESGVICAKIHRSTCNEKELERVNSAKEAVGDLNIIIEEINSLKEETQRIKLFLRALSNGKGPKLVIYDQYDNLNVLPILRKCMNIYNYTLIVVDTVKVQSYKTFGELYSNVNATLESMSDCVIGIHKETLYEDKQLKDYLYANIYKFSKGEVSTIKYSLNKYNLNLSEIGTVSCEEKLNFCEDLSF